MTITMTSKQWAKATGKAIVDLPGEHSTMTSGGVVGAPGKPLGVLKTSRRAFLSAWKK